MDDIILDINGLSCGYGDGFGISDINIKVRKGDFVGIVGRNGSGKTTLFKGITSDIPLTGGYVKMGCRDISEMSIRERSKVISVVAQFSDISEMTVEEYVLMGRIPYRGRFQFFDNDMDVSIARYYMEMTDTYKFRNRCITELSGGEKQMVFLSAALTQQPELLLLDEPTSHLDMTHQIKVMNILRSLCSNSCLTVIMIIHDLSFASEYCDHIVMMKAGKVFKQGYPSDVITSAVMKELYHANVFVGHHPISGKPMIFPMAVYEKGYKMI